MKKNIMHLSLLKILFLVSVFNFYQMNLTSAEEVNDINTINNEKQKSLQRIKMHKLKNGMNVLLIPDKSIPIIGHFLIYNVGGLNDFHGRSGLAHFLEHLMFKSTKNFSDKALTKYFGDNGIHFNAFTSTDQTQYYELARACLLPNIMTFESDRMSNLLLDQKEIDIEREVIKEERRMRVEASAQEEFLEKLVELHYNNNYFGKSLIGSMRDIDSISYEDLENFYKIFYNPQNSILVLSGNIDEENITKLVEEKYGHLTNNSINKNQAKFISNASYAPPSDVTRRIEIGTQAVNVDSYFYMLSAPSIIGGNVKKSIEMEFLSYILKAGKGMLSDKLVNELKIATGVSIQHELFSHDQSPLLIKIGLRDKGNVEKLDKFMEDFFINIDKELNEQEIDRVKGMFRANFIYLMDSMPSKARFYGNAILAGLSTEQTNKFPDIIDNIKIEDLKSLIKEVFVNGSKTIGILASKESSDMTSPVEEVHSEKISEEV